MAGFASSSSLTVVGGILGDMWDPVTRGIAVTVFAGAAFIGPVGMINRLVVFFIDPNSCTVGPIIGGFITMSYLGWRWNAYITLIISFFFCIIGFILNNALGNSNKNGKSNSSPRDLSLHHLV